MKTKIKNIKIANSAKGFSLLEVLIALLIMSFGLIGLASLLVLSLKTNHVAFQRTQATFLAQSMAERMRANVGGIWAGLYNLTYPGGAFVNCAGAVACTPANIAGWDAGIWSDQLTSLLPNATATILCAPSATGAAVSAADYTRYQPSYDGICIINMQWDEAVNAVAAARNQTFSWVFEP